MGPIYLRSGLATAEVASESSAQCHQLITDGENRTSVVLFRLAASLRTQEGEERSLKLRRHGRRRCVTQDARRRQVRGDEGGALRASGHVRFENRAHVVGHHAFEVVHQKLDAGLAGDRRS